MTTTAVSEQESIGTADAERRPLMSGRNLLMMNLGFFGVQFSFALTQSAVNPLFLLIGAEPDQLPILNLAGPITGLLIQPLIGALSDRTWHDRYGRRRPYVIAGAILCSVILFLFPSSAPCGWVSSASGCWTPATTRPWSPTGP
jgi:maltose/moltooligosaccharide transporter